MGSNFVATFFLLATILACVTSQQDGRMRDRDRDSEQRRPQTVIVEEEVIEPESERRGPPRPSEPTPARKGSHVKVGEGSNVYMIQQVENRRKAALRNEGNVNYEGSSYRSDQRYGGRGRGYYERPSYYEVDGGDYELEDDVEMGGGERYVTYGEDDLQRWGGRGGRRRGGGMMMGRRGGRRYFGPSHRRFGGGFGRRDRERYGQMDSNEGGERLGGGGRMRSDDDPDDVVSGGSDMGGSMPMGGMGGNMPMGGMGGKMPVGGAMSAPGNVGLLGGILG